MPTFTTRRLLASVTASAACLAVVPAAAGASCAQRRPVDQLRAAEAAFIGTVVERRGDVVVFRNDETIKGSLPDRVEVRDENPMTSVSLNPRPGETTGLFLRSGTSANDCDRVEPATLRAAEARNGRPCGRPRVRLTSLRRSGRTVRVALRLTIPEGRPDTLRLTWGDGRPMTVKLRAHWRSVRATHEYRRAGRYAVAGSLSVRTPPECGFGETALLRRKRFLVRTG